jgi:hypothetical protein
MFIVAAVVHTIVIKHTEQINSSEAGEKYGISQGLLVETTETGTCQFCMKVAIFTNSEAEWNVSLVQQHCLVRG